MTWKANKLRWTICFLCKSMKLWDNCIIFEDLPLSERVERERTTRTRRGILATMIFQLIPVNSQIHYYYLHSYTIYENGKNKQTFQLIIYNVFVCVIRRLLYIIIHRRKYSIRSGTNNNFYRSCPFRFEYINVLNNMFGRFLNV